MKVEHLIYIPFIAFLCVESPLNVDISSKKIEISNYPQSAKTAIQFKLHLEYAHWKKCQIHSGRTRKGDGRTIKQTQPFARCTAGESGTSQYMFEDTDIYGDGYYGAHGGSGLSAIGGALRVGELVSENQPIKHVLKINVFGKKNLYYDEITKGFRWPAKRTDGYAANNYGNTRTKPVNKECRMGALLALPPSVDLEKLNFETIPGRILAQTFRDYGAYIVDDTAWDVYAIVTEWGPDGRVTDEFEKKWGFSMKQSGKETPWSRDMERIFLNLHVVVNNSPQSIGGGGETRVPLAPSLVEP